ncbi:hypothetical protein P20652_1214 [Pseudoalteromonas sp. BSi20652]|uniref:hypothetical protein n=1 Tax=Pseudoalteromonas sp. BSi20652 TaxID=388384 RepID=UPI0002318634|nr:hypothetical protein [Pseudoalteromonas sp. BSi20652]GAA59353.1 hypothetical protein P20652_1214 [Pseudoalteromonas sp. BSi20652]
MAIAVLKGFSTGQWDSLITVIIVSGVLLLFTFISAKSPGRSSGFTNSGSSHSHTDCGGDSGGGCD